MTHPTPLDAALLAYAKGWTPVSLKPAHKAPTNFDWTTTVYESTDQIVAAFGASSKAHAGGDPNRLNLGLALGQNHGHLVNIDIDHHKALLLAERILPPTAMRSGRASRPGAHFWYLVEGYDPGLRPHTLPDGSMIVEYRATGAQTVIPPSIHPEGERYEWVGEPWGGDEGPRRMTGEEGKHLHAAVLLLAAIVTLADGWPAKGSRHAAYLPLVGGLLRDADEHGQPRVHPWWDRQVEGIIRLVAEATHDVDGAETRIGETVRTTRQKIIRGDRVQGWPTLARIIGEEHVTKVLSYIEQVEDLLGVPRSRVRRDPDEGSGPVSASTPSIEVTSEDAEISQAQREVDLSLIPDEQRDPLRERQNEWEPLDLGPYLRGGVTPPVPGILTRDDGLGLFYPGRVNSLYGPGGSGKTLLALYAAGERMLAGENVMLIDFEDEPHNTLARFQALQIPTDVVAERFSYIRPESAPLASMQVDRWGNEVQTAAGRLNESALLSALGRARPSLIIVDGTTTLYRLHGQDTNAGNGTDIIGGWLRRLTDHGNRTVILIDHTSKNSAPGAGPIGSQHKVAMVQGTALHVHSPVKPRPGIKTASDLYVGKDRPGEVARGSVDGQALLAAVVEFDSTGPVLRIAIKAPNGAQTSVDRPQRLSSVMDDQQNILDVLSDADGRWMSRAEIEAATGLRLSDKKWASRMEPLVLRNIVETSGNTRSKRWRVVLDGSTQDDTPDDTDGL